MPRWVKRGCGGVRGCGAVMGGGRGLQTEVHQPHVCVRVCSCCAVAAEGQGRAEGTWPTWPT